MGNNMRIYDRFEHWSVEDCSCEYCVHFISKMRPCPLEACCVDDIRQEALRREQAAASGAAARLVAASCRG